MADLAVKYGTKKFVMISTDKAVNPTNVMGCSKRICEIYCQSLNKAIREGKVKGVTQFVTTRFGNVLGSNGSVIPIFKDQIKKGGPITVTHPEIIRFFMLIPEACKLVLEAGTMGKGGEIFVFDMGAPVKIVDLAKRMIKLSGAQGIEIKFTGLREGEKLYEEVLNDEEQTKPTHHPKIMIASVREYDYDEVLANEIRLHELSFSFDDMAIVKLMKEIVPEYKSKCSKYEVLD
jgi:FlaA1/EpsC-like NDP-sugar epimerase